MTYLLQWAYGVTVWEVYSWADVPCSTGEPEYFAISPHREEATNANFKSR